MAFVVRRPGGRWEIRESFSSEAGPRARTLASFRVLSTAVLDRALHAARGPIDRDGLIRAAKRAGAPMEPSEGDALAEALLRGLGRGERVRPALRRLLLEHLAPSPNRDDSLIPWIGASLEERAAALVELMDLADRLPKPPK